MAEWKKVIVSGSIAELNQVTASGGFSGDGSGLTGISADSLANALTVDDSTVALDSGTTFNGSAARTISVKDAGITLAKQANMAADRIQGRANGAGTGAPQALTATQVRTIINVENGADVTDATNVAANLPAGTVSGSAQIDGASITNNTVNFGGVSVALNGSDTTPAFDLQDATGYPGDSSLTTLGTVTAGSVTAILPAGTVSGSAQVAMGGDISGNANNATVAKVQGVDLTSGEATQLANINSVTITNTQWGYVGDLDQALTTTSDVNFNDVSVAGNLDVQGTLTTLNTTNLNVEDQFLLLNSGSNSKDVGVIFGGTSGTDQQGKALVWDYSYKSNDGRLAISTTDVAWNATANFGAGTAGYYVGGVFLGSEADAATAKADHSGNIRVESDEIYIYVE